MRLIKTFIFIIILSFFSKLSFAQDSFTGYLMPTVSINYSLSKKVNQAIDVESRNFGYLNNEYQLKAIHLEVLNTTKFKISENKQASFGIRYRKEFDKSEENEFRLHQQYEWKHQTKSLLKHRLRVEERIYSSLTKLRVRYKTGLNFKPKIFCDVLSLANELSLQISKKEKPEYEERVLVEAEWNLSSKSQFAIGSQYRFSDFTRTRAHNLFLTAALSFDL